MEGSVLAARKPTIVKRRQEPTVPELQTPFPHTLSKMSLLGSAHLIAVPYRAEGGQMDAIYMHAAPAIIFAQQWFLFFFFPPLPPAEVLVLYLA